MEDLKYKSKILRLKEYNEHCAIIEAYIKVGQPMRALSHLNVLKKLYAHEVRKIINIK